MANVSKNLLMNRLNAKIQIYLTRISSIFAATHIPNEDEDSSHDVSTKLYNGCLTLSRFGPYCPVALSAPDKKRIKSTEYPVIYKSHVYLCGSEEAQVAFSKHPVAYLRQPTPYLMDKGLSCAIVGGPKSGKTTLAKKHLQNST